MQARFRNDKNKNELCLLVDFDQAQPLLGIGIEYDWTSKPSASRKSQPV